MVILALETVTRAGSVALLADHAPVRAHEGDPARTHGVRLPGELTQSLRDAGMTLRDVDVFAVVTGPGSFTGLRIGLATVQGLALTSGKPVIGIGTLEAMASGWIDAHPGAKARLVVSLDAARGEMFYAVYRVPGAGRVENAAVLVDPRVARPEAAAHACAGIHGDEPWVLVGNGVERFADVWTRVLPDARIDQPMPNLAAAAARLAARRLPQAAAPHAVRPMYVRRPDAELARERNAAPFTAHARTDAPFLVIDVTAADDVAAVADLQARTFADPWGEEAFKGGLSTHAAARLWGLRRADGRLVAYCAGWQVLDELHINSLAVDPELRRQGLARFLLREIMSRVASAGVLSATLEVRPSNEAGRALYESLGFRLEGVRPGYYQNPREDGLILWRRGLSPAPEPADG